jgi:hypothetical protein
VRAKILDNFFNGNRQFCHNAYFILSSIKFYSILAGLLSPYCYF